VFSKNHRMRVLKIKIPRTFCSDSLRIRPISSHNQELAASKHISVDDTRKLQHETTVLWQQYQIRVSWLRGEKKCRWVRWTWARNSARKRWAPIVKPTGGENRCRKISSGHRSQSSSRHTNRGKSASTAESSLGRANHGK
jgi:hypothetical protein